MHLYGNVNGIIIFYYFVDKCKTLTCPSKSVCVNIGSSHQCRCNIGFRLDGAGKCSSGTKIVKVRLL